jgi:AcrR family transcriptional regulator
MGERRRNPRGEGSRLKGELLAAAERIVGRSGSKEAITLRAVAREAGVSAPSIYAHFADAQAIVDCLVDNTFDHLSEILEEARDSYETPRERLVSLCSAYLRFAAEEPHSYLILFESQRGSDACETSLAGDPSSTESRGSVALGLLVDAIQDYLDSCDSTNADARTTSIVVWSALHGYASLTARSPKFPWPASSEEVVDMLVSGLDRMD